MKVSRESSSDEDDNKGDEDRRTGIFFVSFPFEEFFRTRTAETMEESDDDEESGGCSFVYHAGGAKTFLMKSPIEPSDEEDDCNTSGFMIL